jgi:hypothetical protein
MDLNLIGTTCCQKRYQGNWNINTNFTTSKMIVKDLGADNNLTVAGFTNLGKLL